MNEEKNMNAIDNSEFEMTEQPVNTESIPESTTYEYAQSPIIEPAAQKEHFIAGIFGALVGSLIGAVCIVLLGELGYIASICGVIMGVCALKGYCLLAKGISTKGIVASTIIMIIMVYLSNMFSYGLAVAEVYEVDILTGFLATPMLLKEGAIVASQYYIDLVMLYVFTALGAVPTIRKYLKK